MKIEKDTVVALSYSLHATNDGGEKEHVETTEPDQPFVFLFGANQVIPDFEKNLHGKNEGDDFAFSITAENGYGVNDPEAIFDLPIDIFKVNGVIDFEILQTGNMVPMNDENGSQVMGKIVSIQSDSVTMDFNHLLAGKNLFFSGKVIAVRTASPEELSHGHVHDGMEEH